MELVKNCLIPAEGKHLKNKTEGQIFEGCIYLGCYDSKDNYIEVSEEEYQEYLITPIPLEVNENESN